MKKIVFFVVNLLAILVKVGLIFPLIVMGAIDLLGFLYSPTFPETFAYDVIGPYMITWEFSAMFFVVWGTLKATPVYAVFAVISFLTTLVPFGLTLFKGKMPLSMPLFVFSLILGFFGICFLYSFAKKSATFWLYGHSSDLKD